MKPPDRAKAQLVEQWFSKADKDLTAARVLLLSEYALDGTVAFLAQQAAEKYLKGYLAWREIVFPKTHNIAALLELLPAQWPAPEPTPKPPT